MPGVQRSPSSGHVPPSAALSPASSDIKDTGRPPASQPANQVQISYSPQHVSNNDHADDQLVLKGPDSIADHSLLLSKDTRSSPTNLYSPQHNSPLSNSSKSCLPSNTRSKNHTGDASTARRERPFSQAVLHRPPSRPPSRSSQGSPVNQPQPAVSTHNNHPVESVYPVQSYSYHAGTAPQAYPDTTQPELRSPRPIAGDESTPRGQSPYYDTCGVPVLYPHHTCGVPVAVLVLGVN